MTVTLSSRGQLVIPAAIRDHHHLKPKTKFEVLDTGRSLLLVPLPHGDPFLASRGLLKGKLSVRTLLAVRRQERKREAAKLHRLYGLASP
jgi:AbrB family looped-hinge helix DNA binding protein